MTLATAIEAVVAFFNLLRRFDQGDARAAQRLKDILPERTYTKMVREREKALDKAKFGG
jgi:hypothetical protein